MKAAIIAVEAGVSKDSNPWAIPASRERNALATTARVR